MGFVNLILTFLFEKLQTHTKVETTVISISSCKCKELRSCTLSALNYKEDNFTHSPTSILNRQPFVKLFSKEAKTCGKIKFGFGIFLMSSTANVL